MTIKPSNYIPLKKNKSINTFLIPIYFGKYMYNVAVPYVVQEIKQKQKI